MSGRLPSVRPRQLIRVLEQKGWRLARSKGSHHAKDIKRGTLSGILADAGIDRDEFLRLLK